MVRGCRPRWVVLRRTNRRAAPSPGRCTECNRAVRASVASTRTPHRETYPPSCTQRSLLAVTGSMRREPARKPGSSTACGACPPQPYSFTARLPDVLRDSRDGQASRSTGQSYRCAKIPPAHLAQGALHDRCPRSHEGSTAISGRRPGGPDRNGRERLGRTSPTTPLSTFLSVP